MNEQVTIGLAIAGWLATTWLAYRWGLHSQKLQRDFAAKSAAKQRRLEFLGFLKGWRLEFDRLYMESGGFDRRPSSFTDVVSTFVQSAELVRADLSRDQKPEFEKLVTKVASFNGSHFDNSKRYEQVLKAVDELIAYVDVNS